MLYAYGNSLRFYSSMHYQAHLENDRLSIYQEDLKTDLGALP